MLQKRPNTSRESSHELSEKKKPRRGLESLGRTVSPPPAQRRSKTSNDSKSTAAAIEAGEKEVENHVEFYSSHLLSTILPLVPGQPRIPHNQWLELYKRNAGSNTGRHFVVHQHDHPIAGTHYDLRLQCNATSSISFAIMYGLPGDPNSRRLNRNATETRVHCLWNHLIETASHSTGSMLIWDTGEYEILPYYELEDNGDMTDDKAKTSIGATATEQEKLRKNFLNRKLKLRLHGTRLPSGYTISLRLTKDNYRSEQPRKPTRRRKRKAPVTRKQGDDSDHEDTNDGSSNGNGPIPMISYSSSNGSVAQETDLADEKSQVDIAAASDDEDEVIRANNAYNGATNDISSIHQRKWYLSIDRRASGFTKTMSRSQSGFTETRWHSSADEMLATGALGAALGFDRFHVLGRDVERSVVTGRLASEILKDEGVVGYIPRGLWRPVTE